jgi:hypothetical protein
MNINKIELSNFKCFHKTAVDFSKITLLTGPNSSGKSSLIFGLLGALQSSGFPFLLSPNGEFVNMGDFLELSFKKSRNRTVGINLCLTSEPIGPLSVNTIWSFDRRTSMPRLKGMDFESQGLTLRLTFLSQASDYRLNLSFDPPAFRKSPLSDSLEMSAYFSSLMKDFLTERKTAFQRKRPSPTHRPFRLTSIRNRRINDPTQLPLYFSHLNRYDAYFVSTSLITSFSEAKKHINYISPFRLHPERAYYQRSIPDQKVGKFGENTVDQVYDWQIRNSPRYAELKAHLRELGLARTVRTRKLRGGRFEVRVQTHPGGQLASLADVGFGVSQFLPVLVSDLQLRPDSCLIVAQPEIHLHPSVQANLADYFIKQAHDHNRQYIIETHSEYLINRFRALIAKGKLGQDDISTYYFENGIKGSKTYRIQFTKSGMIKGAPPGFFETYMLDVIDIAINS